MKIAVMGTGAIGGYFGGRLAASGEEVAFIARGRQLAALRTRGLALKSAIGDLHLPEVRATDDPKTIGPVDLVLFMVKQFDTASAAAMAKPLIGAATTVLTFQNGIDTEDRLRKLLGAERVMEGAAYIANAAVTAPGVIAHAGTLARLVFGEADGKTSARGAAFLAACRKAGIEAELSAQIRTELWAKFALLAAFSGVSALTRQPIGPILAEPLTRDLLFDALREAVAVALAEGVDLGADYIEKRAAFAKLFPPDAKASMLLDLEHGNRLELDWMSGAVARLGAAKGVPTPIHRFIYAALKLHAAGASRS